MNKSVKLLTPASEGFLPVVIAFAGKAAEVFGLPRKEMLGLQLAVEEIFVHIAQSIQPAENVEIVCSMEHIGIRTIFEFPANRLNLGAFNLTASFRPDRETDLDGLGLFLAARSVDRLKIERLQADRVRLTIEKEKPYPRYNDPRPPRAATRQDYTVREASPTETGLLAKLIIHNNPEENYPEFFQYPDRLSDMSAAGQISAFIGVDPGELIGGGYLWRWLSNRTVECYGPYVFGAHLKSDLNEQLVEMLIQRLARSSCVSLVDQYVSADFPSGYFHKLGRLENNIDCRNRTVYIRMLKEDPGGLAWAVPPLSEFLVDAYRRLALPREIQDPGAPTRLQNDESVLLTHLDTANNSAMLTMAAMGGDIESNLVNHLSLFKDKEIANVYFQLDVGDADQAGIIIPLQRCGFEPKLVIPYGGRGDLAVYQQGAACS